MFYKSYSAFPDLVQLKYISGAYIYIGCANCTKLKTMVKTLKISINSIKRKFAVNLCGKFPIFANKLYISNITFCFLFYSQIKAIQ